MKDQRVQQPLSNRVEDNVSMLKQKLGNSSDLIVRTLKIGAREGGIVYIDGISDTQMISQFIITPLQSFSIAEQDDLHMNIVLDSLQKHIAVSNIKVDTDWKTVTQEVLSGNTVIFLEDSKQAIIASTKDVEARSVAEPTTQNLIRGPKDCFTEKIRTNTALIRTRIASPDLRIDAITVGEVTHTNTAVVYIDGLAKDELVQDVKKRIEDISIDGVLESSYIESFIIDKKSAIFPMVLNTERPDVVAANLLEGRIAIVVDGTPFVLIAPATFFQFFQSPEDYYQSQYIGSFLRILRIISFFLSLLIPALYIAVVTQHPAMIPTDLLFSIAAQREGVPFPTIVEALVMEIAFELLREGGVRMPKAVGSAATIVGALILGQTAVQAGLVSAATIIVVASTAISSFAIPYYNMAITARLLRFLLMIGAAYMGMYSIILILLMLGVYMCNLHIFNMPYLAPLAPFIPGDQKDTFVRLSWSHLTKRPLPASSKNKRRISQKSGESDETE
ncbi:spore germination protein [Peribacillus muralis]|uniref:spore germination protein n=1 Tax=Peribacillus muralis TaxID=264697 RepID=UPI00366D1A3E